MTMPYTLLPPPSSGDTQVNEWIQMGTEAYVAKNLQKAAIHYQRALKLDPCSAIANNNLGVVLACAGDYHNSLLALERASIFDGVEPVIAANQALINFETDRMEEARRCSEKAVNLALGKPTSEVDTAGYIRSRLAYAVISASYGRPQDALPAYLEMMEVEPTHPAAGPNACFVQTLTSLGPADLLALRKQWRTANKWKGRTWPHDNVKDPDKVLRVGYVSGDYKSHSAAMIYSNVLLNHDKTKVTPYLYSTLPTEADKDDMTQKLMACGEWRNMVDKTDEEFEDQVTEDGIDILVDLAGHTNGGRLAVFTRRPAPVQVTAWGFAHGTGLPEIDYFFADPVAVPEHERKHYAEKIYDLPCIVTYRPPLEYGIPATSPMPFKRNDFFTFGSFSRFEKLSDDCLACFNEILKRVPGSKLYLKDAAFRRPYSIRRVMEAMPDVDKSRLIFGVSTSHPEHIMEFQRVDLVLDPFPHGGGNVALETLFAGVPLVTRYGTQAAGRTASSVLTLMGRTDWITRTNSEYVEKAVELSGKIGELAEARKVLRIELLDSPAIKDYAGAVERGYREMWRAWCAK